MSTLHATCASHTHAQTSCSKRVLCPPPRQLRPSTPSHDTRDREPQAQKEKRPYVPPARRRASPPLVSFSTRPAPAHPFMSAVIIPSLCMHPARASEGSDTTPHHNPHSTMTARFTQHKTRPIVTPPDTHNTPSMMGMQAYAPPSLHRVHPTPLPPQLCLSFRALMDYQSPESP